MNNRVTYKYIKTLKYFGLIEFRDIYIYICIKRIMNIFIESKYFNKFLVF